MYSLGIALILAIAQTILKVLARRPKAGKPFPLEREDAIWWVEWVAAGTVALAASLIISSHAHKVDGAGQASTALFAIVCGYIALPPIRRGSSTTTEK